MYYGMDPQFPERLRASGYSVTWKFIQSVFEDYSKRGITKDTDRAAAISGLETRIAHVLDNANTPEKSFGTYELFLHRSLLWHRRDRHMGQINYTDLEVPSWTWMAYTGGISFVDIGYGDLDLFKSLRRDGNTMVSDEWAFADCKIEREADGHVILDHGGEKRGWIKYDVDEGENLHMERGIVLGRQQGEYYTMIVRGCKTEGEYKRVGLGKIQEGYILRQRSIIRIR